MQKTVLILCISLLCTSFLDAQRKSKKEEALIKKMSSEACECLSEKEDLEVKSFSELEIELGICMMGSFGNHQKTMEKLGYSLNDMTSIENLGEQIGMNMGVECEVFREVMLNALAEDQEGFQEVLEHRSNRKSSESRVNIPPPPPPPPMPQMTIELVELKSDQFISLVARNLYQGSSQKIEFLWLEFFEGSEAMRDNFEALKGKKAEIKFFFKEFYNPKIKDYVRHRVIRSIEFIEE